MIRGAPEPDSPQVDDAPLDDFQNDSKKLSVVALGRIQNYLSSIWSQSNRLSFKLKTRLTLSQIKDKNIALNFQKVSSQ